MTRELSVFEKAIAAHARWKYRLFQAIETGTSKWTVALGSHFSEVSANLTMALTKWSEAGA